MLSELVRVVHFGAVHEGPVHHAEGRVVRDVDKELNFALFLCNEPRYLSESGWGRGVSAWWPSTMVAGDRVLARDRRGPDWSKWCAPPHRGFRQEPRSVQPSGGGCTSEVERESGAFIQAKVFTYSTGTIPKNRLQASDCLSGWSGRRSSHAIGEGDDSSLKASNNPERPLIVFCLAVSTEAF